MSVKKPPFCRSAAGFSLIEILVTLAVSGVVIISVATVLTWTTQIKVRSMGRVQMELVKQILIQNLSSPASWSMTVSKNQPSMACLLPDSTTPCTPNQPARFSLWDAGGNLIFDATDPAAGFNAMGEPCNPQAFAMAGGNDACPFRYELQWSAVCDPSGTPTCINPQVLLNAHLYYRPADMKNLGPIDENNLSINGLYMTPPGCTGGAQQVFIYNTNSSGALNTSFVVPNYTKHLFVEMWGGGGGGPTYSVASASFVPGNAGTDSSFVPPTATGVTAAGGAGGYSETLSEKAWWFVHGAFYFPWSGSCNGFPGEPPNATILNGVTSCAPFGASVDGGSGGVCEIHPSISSTGNISGRRYGGGGGSGGTWITDCGDWAFLYLPQSSDNGGRYRSATYTPATLPPGTVVPVTVGAGGAGAVGSHFTACWGAFPSYGGNGASGLVKITWE